MRAQYLSIRLDTSQPLRCMRIIEVYDGNALFRQRIKQASFFFCHTHQRPHASKMCSLCIRDDSNRWLRQLGQRGNFSGMAHAQLNHSVPMLWRQTQERERQADFVIEVTQRTEHGIRTDRDAKEMRHEFFGRGLTVGPGDSHDGQTVALAPGLPQGAQRKPRIITNNQRPAIQRRRRQHRVPCFNDRSDSTGLTHFGQKFMRIELLATQSDEQIPHLQCARICRDALHHNASRCTRQCSRQPVGHQ